MNAKYFSYWMSFVGRMLYLRKPCGSIVIVPRQSSVALPYPSVVSTRLCVQAVPADTQNADHGRKSFRDCGLIGGLRVGVAKCPVATYFFGEEAATA